MVEMNNIPFSTKPVKARYMWRDVERRAATYGIAWSAIPPYPLKDLGFPNRIALLGVKEGWCAEYVTDTARALGIFGAPTFVTGEELFWGDDRLSEAIAWHRRIA
jgi:2-hydroxychromene-2-carboxylate isomerase